MNRQTHGRNEKWSMKAGRLALFLLFALILSSAAMALGVAPSRQYVEYTPGQTISGQLTIINNEGNEFRAGVYGDGEFADIVKLPNSLILVPKEQQTVTVPYEITLPESMRPGEQVINIVIRQFPVESEGGTVVTAQMAVIAEIIVRVPYPGKYAEAKMFISDADKTDRPVTFTTMVYNFGTDDIKDASVQVGIFGPTWEQVGESRSAHVPIKSKQETRIDALWEPNVSKGSYVAVATVRYDDKTLKIEKAFDLGAFTIDVSDISVKKFTLGDVAKFDITLFNSWNSEIKDIYVEMIVEDKLGNKMTEFKTTTVDIPAQAEKTVEAYWYTEGVTSDTYKVKLLVHYAGKVTEKDYDFQVGQDSITRAGTEGYAIMGKEAKKALSMQSFIVVLIIIVVLILIAMNVIWYYILNKKLKGGQK
jgi:hypothetical protein